MDNELKQYLDSQFKSLDQRFVELRTEFRAELEATETRLLSEFWKWGRSAD